MNIGIFEGPGTDSPTILQMLRDNDICPVEQIFSCSHSTLWTFLLEVLSSVLSTKKYPKPTSSATSNTRKALMSFLTSQFVYIDVWVIV